MYYIYHRNTHNIDCIKRNGTCREMPSYELGQIVVLLFLRKICCKTSITPSKKRFDHFKGVGKAFHTF